MISELSPGIFLYYLYLITFVPNDTYAIVVAALLHDIGKLCQRAGVEHHTRYNSLNEAYYGLHGAHAKWSADVVREIWEDPLIEDLVLYHHMPERSSRPDLARILQEADHRSAAIDRKARKEGEKKGDPKKELLRCIFQQIYLEKLEQIRAQEIYYRIQPLTLDTNIFPGKVAEVEPHLHRFESRYRQLYEGLMKDLRRVTSTGTMPSITTLSAILKKYTSYVPSATYVDIPDIPLYDHARTTAAIATCLLEGNRDKPFLFVQGDLSGIQSYIFNVASPEEARKGMAKRLRGRSFWLILLMDAVASELIDAASVPETNILWNTGGNFLVLLPNKEKIRDAVERIDKQLNQALLDEMDGHLALVFGQHTCNKEEIENFLRIRNILSDEVQKGKTRKFNKCEIEFVSDKGPLPIADFCNVCGQRLRNGECHACREHLELGSRITRAGYILKGEGLRFSFESLGLKTCYDLVEKVPDGGAKSAVALNDPDSFLKGNIKDCSFGFIGSVVPSEGERILTFGEIAQMAEGDRKLGVFKADMDRLGQLMAIGIPKYDRSISRINSLSSQLDLFFTGYLNKLCSEFGVYKLCPDCSNIEGAREIKVERDGEEGSRTVDIYYHVSEGERICDRCRNHFIPTLYIVFAGGDDLLVIGPYDHIFRFARRFYEDFKRFVGNHPDITFSAGIVVTNPRVPIAIVIERAEAALERAKEEGRNCICVENDEVLLWSSKDNEKGYLELLEMGDKIYSLVKKRAISRSAIHTMEAIWKASFDKIEKDRPSREIRKGERSRVRSYTPFLKYLLTRNVQGGAGVREEVESLIVPSFGWIRLPLMWTAMRTRRV